MNPKYPTIILGVLLILTSSVSANNVIQLKTLNKGNTLYVGGSGPGNYTKIQKAIDDAHNGDTIFVYSGHYYEQILINKTITLLGEHHTTTFLNSYFHSTVIQVTSPAVTIQGFTIQNSSTHPTKYYAGIKGLADNLQLNNLRIINNGIGIFLQDSQAHHLQSLQLHNNGLYIENSINNMVQDCWVNNKPLIYLEHTHNQQITNAGQVIINHCTNISVDTTSLCNATVGMQIHNCNNISLRNASIDNNTFGGILIKDSDIVCTSNCYFGDNRYIGIDYTNVHGATCSTNTFTQGSNIHIIDSSDLLIQNNTIIDCGISLKNTSYSSINNNHLSNQTWGISLYSYCHDNHIIGNILENPFGGIRIEEHSTNNIIQQNHLTGGYIGIELYRYSTDNTFIKNTIQDTSTGIDIDFGCNSNHFNNNHLQNNTHQGISINQAEHQHLINNTFINNGLVITNPSYHTITNNTVNDLPLIYATMESELTITNAGQVILVTCTDTTIQNLTIANATRAVQLLDSSKITIQESHFTDNEQGIALIDSTDNTIINNNFNNNTEGINLQNSKRNQIHHNTIKKGGAGISLIQSPQNTLQENTITNQQYYGIQIAHSNRNTITYNTITQNKNGIYINDYIEWLTSLPLTSKRNTIKHNNIYNNQEHNAYFENGLLNTWNHNYYNTTQKITIIPGEIYAERGWHFGSPPPIHIKCYRLDWQSATSPNQIK